MVGYQKLLQVPYLRILSKIPVGGSASSSHEGIVFFEVDTTVVGSSVSIFDLVRISSLSRRGCPELSSV